VNGHGHLPEPQQSFVNDPAAVVTLLRGCGAEILADTYGGDPIRKV
jgi:hypothetical protein